MKDRFNRRDVIKTVFAGAIVMTEPLRAELPESPLTVRSARVELCVTTVSAQTVRLTILPVEDGRAQPLRVDGALIARE
jgi:hypothetical protein